MHNQFNYILFCFQQRWMEMKPQYSLNELKKMYKSQRPKKQNKKSVSNESLSGDHSKSNKDNVKSKWISRVSRTKVAVDFYSKISSRKIFLNSTFKFQKLKLKFIYSEKAKSFCEISIVDLIGTT